MKPHIEEAASEVPPVADLSAFTRRRSRDDQATAQTIDHALRLLGQSDAYHAALMLRARGIPLDLTLRVLLRPGQRRAGPRIEGR